MSVIICALESLGHEVEQQVFAANVESHEIKRWIESSKAKFMGCKWLLDDTCWSAFPYNEGGKFGITSSISSRIDTIFNEAVGRIILGELYDQETFNEGTSINTERIGRAFSLAVKHVPESEHPTRVYIDKHCICDHAPFNSSNTNSSKAASDVKEWLVAGGIPDEAIQIIEEGVLLSEIDQQGYWFIADRHFAHTRDFNFQNARMLRLPFVNFYEDIQGVALIGIGSEAIKAVLTEIIEEEFRQG